MTMRVVINGMEREIPRGTTVAQLLEQEEEPPDHVLVEVNGVYLPAQDHARRTLEEGDRVEIILPAFGG
jgi:thiamine biosynthesis protein ThiS